MTDKALVEYQHRTGRLWLRFSKNPGVCNQCDGCGLVADNEKKDAWWIWATLPYPSNTAGTAGTVKPVVCTSCNGSGKQPK